MKIVLERIPFFEKRFSDGTLDPWANLKVTWTIETKRKKNKG